MKLNIGILGAGKIAAKMADTVAAMRDDGVQVLAVASRGLPKAQAFAAAHGVPRAYGSYEAMLADKDIHLVYIATPHSHHAAYCERGAGKACDSYGEGKGPSAGRSHLDALYALAPAYLRHY